MRSGRSRFNLFLTALSALLTAVPVASAQSRNSSALPGRGRSIQFSDPRSSVVSSNVNEIGANKTRLEDLEQQLRKPFEIFGTGNDSINRIETPVRRPPPSAAKMRQMKDLLEKRKEWIFLGPEDYAEPGLTAEEMLNVPEYGPDGEEKKRKTPIERYYERLDKARAEVRAAVTNQTRDDIDLAPLQADKTQEGLLGAKELNFGQPTSFNPGFGAVEKTLKQLVPRNRVLESTFTEPNTGNSVAELFGFGKVGNVASVPDQSQAREARMQEFKQLLEMRSPVAPNSAANALNPVTSPLATPPADYGASPGVGTRIGPLSPAAVSNPSGLVPASANPALPAWQTQPAAPQTPALKLPPPVFNIPQRKF